MAQGRIACCVLAATLLLTACGGGSGGETNGVAGEAGARRIDFLPARDYEAATVTSGLGAGALASSDFDGDGDADLAVSDCFGQGPAVLLNRGDGSFEAPTHPSVLPGGPDACTVASGDFDEDGHADIASVSQASTLVSLLLGRGDGRFTPGERFAAGSGLLPQYIAVADFNRDGHQDLGVVLTRPGQVAIFLGHGDGHFTAAGALSFGGIVLMATPADFNGDGIPDLAAARGSADAVAVALGRGDGRFGDIAEYATGRDPEYVATADLDGDGHLDLVTANSFNAGSGELSLLFGTGDGRFRPEQRLHAYPDSGTRIAGATSDGPAGVAVADFNRDGKPDLAVPAAVSSRLVILRNLGAGQFVRDGEYAISLFPEPVLAQDFNDDGWPDLVSSANLPALAQQAVSTRIAVLINVTGANAE